MICLPDVGLFVLDVDAWNRDRSRCLGPMTAMTLHRDWLQRFRVRLAWSDDFFNGFPWNQPGVPPDLIDYCTILMQFHDRMQANDLLVTVADPPVPSALPIIAPDLFDAAYLEAFREGWLLLLASLARDSEAVAGGIGVPTWERPTTRQHREIQITNATDLSAAMDIVPLLKTEADWNAFVQQYHRPDLTGRRIAVLGGRRDQYERAAEQLLNAFHADQCIWLPPLREEHRTQSQTRNRLGQVDLLVICWTHIGHADTDHIPTGTAPCPYVYAENETANQIVKAVMAYFQRPGEGAG